MWSTYKSPVVSVGPSTLWLSVQETQLLTTLFLLLSQSYSSDTNLQLCISRLFGAIMAMGRTKDLDAAFFSPYGLGLEPAPLSLPRVT